MFISPQQLLLFGQVLFAFVQVKVVKVLVQVEVVKVEWNGRFFRLHNPRHLEQIATDFKVLQHSKVTRKRNQNWYQDLGSGSQFAGFDFWPRDLIFGPGFGQKISMT